MIKIIHAYPDLMNIFGGAADVLAMERYLKAVGEDVEVHSFETGEDPMLDDADIFYCGAGTEERMSVACRDAKRYKDEFRAFTEKGGHAVLMGTGMALAGEAGTEIADVKLEVQDYRHYSDVISVSELTGDIIVGAFNASYSVDINEKPFSKVQFDSNKYIGETDGFIKNNVIGSAITAPLMARNPVFLKNYLEKLLGRTLPDINERWYREAVLGYENALKMLEE